MAEKKIRLEDVDKSEVHSFDARSLSQSEMKEEVGARDNATIVPPGNPSETRPKASGTDHGKSENGRQSSRRNLSSSRKCFQKSRTLINKFLESIAFSITTTVATLYALFFSDIVILSMPKSVDEGVGILNFIVFIFFLIELFLSCYAKDKYIGRFYFWLDIVSTASLLLDVPFFMDAVTGNSGSAEDNPILQQTVIARASRAARIGTRAGRIVRLFRIVRMLKMLKVVSKKRDQNDPKSKKKSLKTSKVHVEAVKASVDVENPAEENGKGIYAGNGGQPSRDARLSASINMLEKELMNDEEEDEADDEELKKLEMEAEQEPSNIYRRITELTSRKVVIGVLIMMFVLPQLDFDTSLFVPISDRGSPSDPLNALSRLVQLGCGTSSDCLSSSSTPSYVKTLSEDIVNSMMVSSITVLLGYPTVTLVNITSANYSVPTSLLVTAGYNIKPADWDVLSSWTYDEAARLGNELRDNEILVYSSSDGVFSAIYSEKKDKMVMAALGIAQTLFVTLILTLGGVTFSKDVNRLVVRPIERMVDIVKNLSMNPLTALGNTVEKAANGGGPGLETDMVEGALVRIGRLLQVGFGEAGAAVIAKNIHGKDGKFNPVVPGERITAIFGFCDIRRFTDATESLQEEVMLFVNAIAHIVHAAVTRHGGFPNKNIGDAFLVAWKETKENGTLKLSGDGALRSFLDTIREIAQSHFLKEVAERPVMKKNLGQDYTIRMGFGIHLGWAIEGAIGSNMKIDASYLSPHVNISSRLEAATKQYGVMMLISGEVVKHIKSDLLERCRKIDRVTVKGSKSPIEMWTYDVVDPFVPPKYGFEEFDGIYDSPCAQYADYKTRFEQGIECYIGGNWDEAISKLRDCKQENPHDKPCQVILDYMEENQDALGSWPGYRELTEK
uniref:Guanylate cyclase domain-containing protein n=1 Tax=Palpitomonas bilix TaxID=652834 RepID=A0A7S3CW70_9EUKA|mmetsp:Transcript_11637/g.31273  ORF Transcript_11637/g.31273 Transcript_11637/m.31273 type:complete len:900 (+) Transcript_11637:438-3137(+)